VPAVVKFFVYVAFGLRTGDAKDPLSATTWWLTVSSFRQRMLSPVWIVRVTGLNPSALIATTRVTAANATPAAARPRAATTSSRAFFMSREPPFIEAL
jgi:hypothetical protein